MPGQSTHFPHIYAPLSEVDWTPKQVQLQVHQPWLKLHMQAGWLRLQSHSVENP